MSKVTTERKSNSNLAIAGFLGLTVLLIVFFLSVRGADVWKLPQFLGEIFNGNIFSFGGFGAGLLGLLIAFLIVAAWFGLGRFITRLFEKEENFNALDFARSCAFGAGAWSLIWFFLGLFSGYNRFTAIGFLIIGLGLAIYFAPMLWRSLRSEENSAATIFEKVALGLIIFTLLLSLISALAPPTAKDALLYHTALPKAFVAQGSNQIVEGNIASFLALGVEMQNVWAMLLGNVFDARTGEAAVGAVVFMFAPLLVLAIYGWAREFEIEASWAWLAALLVAAIPTFYHVASSVYVDLALALFVTLAIHSIAKWWLNTQETKWLAFAAIALGAALSIKLTTAFVIASLALIVLLRARNAQSDEAENGNAGSILIKGFTAFVLAGLIASPWYLRTWAKTGSPIFPFYMNLWKGTATGWDAERSALFQAMNSAYGGAEKGFFDYLLAPVKISLWAQPELPEYFDGVMGVSFLLGLILIVWAWRRFDFPVELKIAVGTSGIVFLFWLFSSQQLRYILPIVPSLAVATVVAADLISSGNAAFRKVVYAGFLATSLVGILTAAAWFAEKNPLRVVFGGESAEDYLTRRIDYYRYYKIINRDLPPDARIWLINMRRDSYHLDRAYFSDYLFESWTLKRLVEESRDVNDLRQKAKQMGITHVLTRHDFLLDYGRTDIVEERRPEQENRAKLKMTEEFVLDKANTIQADKKFSLVKLP
jgi:hypothetical protein